MRRVRPSAATVLVGIAAAAATAAAATSADRPTPGDVRTCASRGDSSRPAKPPARGTTKVGPFVIWGFDHLQPAGKPAWPYVAKMPVLLRARVRAVLAIAPESVGTAGLWKLHGGGYVSAVRFLACREREPAWTYKGTVGKFTMFPSSIALKTPKACVVLQAWVDGETAPHTVTVGVGRSGC